MTRVGITGHRDLSEATCRLVAAAITKQLGEFGSVHGISSLAEGADQIFAEQVLKGEGALTAVIPSAQYGRSFATTAGKAAYRQPSCGRRVRGAVERGAALAGERARQGARAR